jgi:CAAX protease family protein
MTETATQVQPETGQSRLIASPIHTAILLGAIGVQSFRSAVRAGQLRGTVNLDHMRLYERTILVEWLMFGLMIAGVWLAGSSLFTVLGERWRSVRAFLLDVGLAVAFLAGSVVITSLVGALLGAHGSNEAAKLLQPHGSREIITWIALSLTAGICEEAIFRGYLQRQFIALTRSVPAGILLSAAAFGAAHSYQGYRGVIQISLLGVMLGLLAYWRKTVRPGMISHALQDTLAIFAGH